MFAYCDTPFRHWLFPGPLFTSLSEAAADAVPGPEWVGWEARYENDCERGKRTCRDAARLPGPWRDLLARLNAPQTVALLGAISGVEGLRPDPTLHGGGLHVTEPGGWLQPHLDYALHPTLGLERRLNLVLFLNREWRDEWGGAFELYDDAGRECVRRVRPFFGGAVLWEPSDTAFHGTEPVSPDAPPRVTAAVYYLAPPRPGATRKRALFVPRRVPAGGQGPLKGG